MRVFISHLHSREDHAIRWLVLYSVLPEDCWCRFTHEEEGHEGEEEACEYTLHHR